MLQCTVPAVPFLLLLFTRPLRRIGPPTHRHGNEILDQKLLLVPTTFVWVNTLDSEFLDPVFAD